MHIFIHVITVITNKYHVHQRIYSCALLKTRPSVYPSMLPPIVTSAFIQENGQRQQNDNPFFSSALPQKYMEVHQTSHILPKKHKNRIAGRQIMMFIKTAVLAILASSAWTVIAVNGFVVPSRPSTTTAATASGSMGASSSLFSSPSDTTATTTEEENDLGLTPELKRVVDAFAAIGDEQVRYKQLLYMAQTTPEANSLPESSKVPSNKVPGCLSTVYVDGTATYNDEIQDYVIDFKGDSDGLLTKGLVALLVRCLSGNTCESIQKVDPQFIKVAKIEQSLTPGRNNGFLNMLKTMKDKARQLDSEARSASSSSDPTKVGTTETETGKTTATDNDTAAAAAAASTESTGGQEGGPKYNAMLEALQKLQPISLKLVDNSHQHAGHAGNDAKDGESHFDLSIVSDAFDGLNLVKRHQLIYMMLGDIMPTIHALQISVALTPGEAKERGLTS